MTQIQIRSDGRRWRPKVLPSWFVHKETTPIAEVRGIASTTTARIAARDNATICTHRFKTPMVNPKWEACNDCTVTLPRFRWRP